MKIQQLKSYNISSRGRLKVSHPQIFHAVTPIKNYYTSSEQIPKIDFWEKFLVFPLIVLINKLHINHTSEKDPLRDIQEKIESGNGKINSQAFTPLDIDNPIFDNIEKASEYLASKIEKQAGVLTKEDITNSVNKLSKKYNIAEQEVIDIMARITQFGSYKQLKLLEEQLKANKIYNFYDLSKISLNRVFRYIHGQKEQMSLFDKQCTKTAFIIDDYAIEHLENLYFSTLGAYKALFGSGDFVMINLDGTRINLNGKNYSYTAFDGGVNLEALTEAVIIQKKEGKSDEEIFNGNYKEKIEQLFGSDIADKIVNIRLTDNTNTVQTILNRVNPVLPDKKTILSVLNVNSKINSLPEQNINKIKSLMLKYFDNMIKIYSPDGIAEVLKQRHSQIENYVKSIGGNVNDIFYVVPCNNKSFNLIDYMYCRVNNINPSKFINLEETVNLPKNGIAVLIDDVIGSGDSMLFDPFDYYKFRQKHPGITVIFSSINSSEYGYNQINKELSANKPTKNTLILDDLNISDFTKFKNKLSDDDRGLLSFILGYLGHTGTGIATAFPYMVPDNCSSLASYLMDFCLLKSNYKSNKALPNYDILKKIKNDMELK